MIVSSRNHNTIQQALRSNLDTWVLWVLPSAPSSAISSSFFVDTGGIFISDIAFFFFFIYMLYWLCLVLSAVCRLIFHANHHTNSWLKRLADLSIGLQCWFLHLHRSDCTCRQAQTCMVLASSLALIWRFHAQTCKISCDNICCWDGIFLSSWWF